MDRLRRADLRAVMQFLQEMYACVDLEAFKTHIVTSLPKIIGSEITTFSVNNLHTKTAEMAATPPPDVIETVLPGHLQIWDLHMHEHPIVTYNLRTGDNRPRRISDFLTRTQFHRLGLYNELFRWIGIEYQLAFLLPAPRDKVIGVAVHRDRLDYSERERLMAELLRPHLTQAYLNAQAFTSIKQQLALVTNALEALSRGVVVIGQDGRVRLATTQARRILAQYFDETSHPEDTLPLDLAQWVKQHVTAPVDDISPLHTPLVVERAGKRLTVRLLTGHDERLLLLEERETIVAGEVFRPLGLTSREAEVLAWVVRGKTNAEIGQAIGASVRTVGKHLENIYGKLEVRDRSAAATYALEAVSALRVSRSMDREPAKHSAHRARLAMGN